jgi:hypothetical protein
MEANNVRSAGDGGGKDASRTVKSNMALVCASRCLA